MPLMSEHLDRKREIFRGVIPKEGTPEFEKLSKAHEKQWETNPEFKKFAKQKFEKAAKTAIVQNANGINIGVDNEIRHFLREFNERVLKHGLRSMPLLFNVMEAFFEYDKTIIYFELLEEEDYMISFLDFFNYYTSDEFKGDVETIKIDFEENLVYSFNAGADIDQITFKTEEGNEYVVGGISMVRRNNEITVLIQAGEITDIEKIEIPDIENNGITTPGKEKLREERSYDLNPETLNGNPDYLKSLIICRFDLDSETIDGRFVAKDFGTAFQITTDEISGFLQEGNFISADLKTAYESQLKAIEKYNPVFEVAKAALHLPSYFNTFEDKLDTENHETGYKNLVKSPFAKREYRMVDSKFKIGSRDLWILNRNDKFSADRLLIMDSGFKIEKSGYWKTLNADEYGIDKKGGKIIGKTWVNRTDSFFESKVDPIIISNVKSRKFSGPNAGYIYVMRSPQLPVNTFKIGLTTKTPEERADQLSKTSVPDRFFVMNEWEVADCKDAEAQIHTLLDKYRVDPRREFFSLEMKTITETVQKVVEDINKDS